MKTKLILLFSIVLILSACQNKPSENDSLKQKLISQKVSLPNGQSIYINVYLALYDSTYLIDIEPIGFDSKDDITVLHFHEERDYITQGDPLTRYCSSIKDSIIVSDEEMKTSWFQVYRVGAQPEVVVKEGLFTQHITVDILARTESLHDDFRPIARVEFFPEDWIVQKKIDNIVIWEAKQVYETKTVKIKK